jgi:DNA-binding transcriptional ArsR family regulator
VPKVVSPPLPVEVMRSVEAFGSPTRVAALRHLLAHGPMTSPQLARELGMTTSMMANHLAVLEELGAVTVDPPRSEPDRKPRRFAVERKHVDALLKSLSMSLTGAL